ncbi:putative E3 ubiquitin-protein ligase MARCH [Helianthus annuus]|nr:putative E3 ubiquitin-protein ligase MARCH [Helianthus annuus]KAJ0595956.1 putative E3 ubiquitin-protein ligase MARCH [Helianthus annuus]
MNFRGNWEISGRDLYSLRVSSMGYAGDDEPNFDEYITLSSKSLICCCVLAIIFMTLLVLRHALPIIINGTRGYTVTIFGLVLMLRVITGQV